MDENQTPALDDVVNSPPVTSKVDVQGALTVRTYSDGSVQRNVWDSADRAQEYAASVHEQEGE